MKDNLLPRKPASKDKVAILGFSPSWKLAPFDDPEWEIWGLNALYEKQLPRYDRWFEIHKRKVNLDDEGPEHIWKLAALTCPIYMIEHFEDIPTSVAYPLDFILGVFRPYLTSSFSYMVALAITENFKEIGIYGVDTADEEGGAQRPSLEYFLGYAEGKGIKITIPKESSLLRAPFLYGYQEREETEFLGKILNLERNYQKKAQEANDIAARYESKAIKHAGAAEALKALRAEWLIPFDFENLRGKGSADD